MKKILVLITALLCGQAAADEASVKKILEERISGIPIDRVEKTPFFGLYEIRSGSEIFYTDEQVTHILIGNVLDGRTLENLTKARTQKINAIDFSKLPLNQAIPVVRGKGTRKMAYFADPLCGYCKKMDASLAQMDNVTVYVFLYPILAPRSLTLSRAVWCAPDPAKAWTDLMLKGIEPKAKADCSPPEIERNLLLGRDLKISGTPGLVFENSTRVDGFVQADKLKQLLDEAVPK